MSYGTVQMVLLAIIFAISVAIVAIFLKSRRDLLKGRD